MDADSTIANRDGNDAIAEDGVTPHGARYALTGRSGSPVNAMTVDVEDYFQVSAFGDSVQRADWGAFDARVEANTDRILALFDDAGIYGTFFTLGWVAERFPGLIRRITQQGHELASHGYEHQRATAQTADEFRADIRRTRDLLEQLSGVAVTGYRAASFSFDATNAWTHGILAEEGYRYSSSVFPVRHDHYGMPHAPRFPYRPDRDGGVVEIPLTTVRLWGRNLPCAGGGYFRLLPYPVYRGMLRRVCDVEQRSAVFFFHPWEIDPAQPRQQRISFKTRFRHYVNLGRMEGKIRAILSDFAWDRMDRVFQADIEGTSWTPGRTQH